jgi:septum formation protein
MDIKLILGSKSPRRVELLQMADLEFEQRTADVEEIYPEDINLRDIPVYLSELKAKHLKGKLANHELLLTADTIVIKDGKVYEKPSDAPDAKKMIAELSGEMHEVVTGFTITFNGEMKSWSNTTKVWFRKLSSAQIEYYVNRYKPFDKAGSYAIQEWIGVVGVEKIEGDIYSVIGLPIGQVVQAINQVKEKGRL